ncbi:MAG: FmdB family zinc ribbon protein [Candidatus Aminicenantes bacterium]
MPLYEYRCLRCGVSFEVLQKIGDSPLKKCLKCGGVLKKIISPPAIQFKGSGWYVTDYSKKNKTEEGEKKTPEKPKKQKPDTDKDKKDNQSSSSG